MHRTQPRQNFTVFYRRVAQTMIMVLGVGQHNANNRQYSVQWADGSANRVSLAVTRRVGPLFLPNPIGGRFGFRTMDAVLNEHFLAAEIVGNTK
jgi:hypothetical protein